MSSRSGREKRRERTPSTERFALNSFYNFMSNARTSKRARYDDRRDNSHDSDSSEDKNRHRSDRDSTTRTRQRSTSGSRGRERSGSRSRRSRQGRSSSRSRRRERSSSHDRNRRSYSRDRSSSRNRDRDQSSRKRSRSPPRRRDEEHNESVQKESNESKQTKSIPEPVAPVEEPKRAATSLAAQPTAFTGRTGGVYIPPFKLARMQKDAAEMDKASKEYQRISWEALRKSINGLVNKVFNHSSSIYLYLFIGECR